MIYDELKNVGRYRGLYPNLDVLIDWLDGHAPEDLRDLPLGRNEIAGDDVFANVMEAQTRAAADAHYETHHAYMDLQIDLVGREAFKTAAGATTLVQPFDEKDDFELVDAERSLDGNLDEGHFALFVVNEPHMPTLEFPGDGVQPVKKVCFKIRV